MAEEPGFVFDVVTCVNKHSYMRLEEMKEFLLSLGVKRWRLFTVFPVGRAAKDPELQLSNRDFQRGDGVYQTYAQGGKDKDGLWL